MSEKIVTDAIVLRRADYRENDRMLTLFSPELGAVEALCRGCRRQNSPLLAAGELFASGEYVLFRRGDKCIVTECRINDSFYPLREDVMRLSHGMYLLELTAAAVQPEQENRRLFLFLLKCLAHLAYGEAPQKRVTAVFLMGILSLSGFRPIVGRCTRCGLEIGLEERAFFSISAGGLLCGDCRSRDGEMLLPEELLFLRSVMQRGLEILSEPGECSERVFRLLRALAEDRLELTSRVGKML